MSQIVPYTYYACPCTNTSDDTTFERVAFGTAAKDEDDEGEDSTLDPTKPRTNHVLHPLESLLFCNECHEIRCPRCFNEEVLYYYCPNCLMETAGTTVKTETNRCTRSCLQCPTCATALQIQSLADSTPGMSSQSRDSKSTSSRDSGPWILACPYCTWSTLQLGIKFDKSINLISQLAKKEELQARTLREHQGNTESTQTSQFDSLKEFYKTALAEADPTVSVPGLGSSFGLDSPSHLSRLLNQYGIGGLKKQRQKPKPMRESASATEGLMLEPIAAEDEIIEQMRSSNWDDTASVEQQSQQVPAPGPHRLHYDTRFLTDLRPTPIKLRSRRAKRCQVCRYHLLRPDDKRHSTRNKVRLLALNYIPRINASPLHAEATRPDPLRPGVPQQFLLTCRNPLYDPLKVKLATPSTVSGMSGSRITILCPQFDIGASADVWDEALTSGKATDDDGTAKGGTAEAGKVWKKGRNWTSIILEVVAGFEGGPHNSAERRDVEKVLEIPIFVRMEYYTDASAAGAAGLASPESSPGWKSTKEDKIPKELEFWVVVGLGQIASRATT